MAAAITEPLYLCIDQGGHASRALVFDTRGGLRASSVCAVATRFPQPDWVEHDPQELVSSLQTAITQTLTSLGDDAQRIVSAGIATQRSSIVCWDKFTGVALSPAISWQDRRAHKWLEQFSPQAADIQQRTGLRLSAHYGASKMRWCLDHLPAVTAAYHAQRLAIGPLASFLLFRLLDEKPLLVDPANAARSLLYNLERGEWDAELLKLFGIAVEILPACVPTRYDYGMLSVNQRRIPLTIMTGDQSAALFTLGAPRLQLAYINIGTGAFIQRVFAQPAQAAGLLSGVVYRDAERSVYVLEGTVNGAGAALKWAEQAWGLQNIERLLPQWLARADDVPLFLNGVAGLGAPFWKAQFTSRLVGAGDAWERAVAVVESIVFLLHTNFELMQKISPRMTGIFISGGLARYDGLCQRLADLNGAPVERAAEHEATARGTAYLLAAAPPEWEAQAVEQFQPRANRKLDDRYRHWHSAMRAALTTD
ncbi:MAG: glycerol kinase [Gammaproteobacteria bacterium]|nr:glycerol kinase [Gammaproteobacteria bacterium]